MMVVASNISDLFINRGKSKWINVMYTVMNGEQKIINSLKLR
jgi:hypothetical protein